MRTRRLMPGYFLELDEVGKFGHYVGGDHKIRGAWCPNCDLPLMLHMSLDTLDPRIDLDLGSIPLLYCGRCALSWYSFVYNIVDDDHIEIIRATRGEVLRTEWNEDVGFDVFPRRPFQLRPIPGRLQELYDQLNAGKELTPDEEAEVAAITGQYADIEVGGYPSIDVINQIGGRSFLSQRLHDPICRFCRDRLDMRRRMYFMASMTNDRERDLVVTYDGVQIVFFFCPFCRSMHVVHSI